MAQVKPSKRQAKIRVAALGATGYAGVELLRILVQHPRVKLAVVTAQQYVGKRVSEVYPSLRPTMSVGIATHAFSLPGTFLKPKMLGAPTTASLDSGTIRG